MTTVWLMPVEELFTTRWIIWIPSKEPQYIGKGPHNGLFPPGSYRASIEIVNQQTLAHRWVSPKSALTWALAHGYKVKARTGVKYQKGSTYIRVEVPLKYIGYSKETIAQAIKEAIEDTHPAVIPEPGCEITFGFLYTRNRGSYIWDYCKFKRDGDKIVSR